MSSAPGSHTHSSNTLRIILKSMKGCQLHTQNLRPPFVRSILLSAHRLSPTSAYCISSVFAHASSLCTQCSWKLCSVILAAIMLQQPGVMKTWGISWWQELCVDSRVGRAPQGASEQSHIIRLGSTGEGMKYELLLISRLITVLTSAMSYLLQECRGIWIISS